MEITIIIILLIHDKIGLWICCKVFKYYGILDCKKWYKHQPEPITEGNFPLHLCNPNSMKNIKQKTRYKVLRTKKEKGSLPINMSVPTDNNISVKKSYKISKYKDLEIK